MEISGNLLETRCIECLKDQFWRIVVVARNSKVNSEKIQGLISEIRPDKALLNEREEGRKKHSRDNSVEI